MLSVLLNLIIGAKFLYLSIYKSILCVFCLLVAVQIASAQEAESASSPDKLLLEKINLHLNDFACDSVFFYAEHFFETYPQRDSLYIKVLESVLSCQNILEQYEEALSTAQLTEEVLNETKEPAYSYFSLHREKSKIYMALDSVQDALSELEQCLEYASKVEVSQEARCKSLVYVDMGLLYYSKFGKTRKALDLMQKALPFTQQILNKAPSNRSSRNHFMVFNNIATMHNVLGEFDSAFHYFVQSEDLFETYQDAFTEKEQCMFYHNASLMYIHQKKGELALDVALKAIARIDKIENLNLLFVSWAVLAESYLLVGEVKKAMGLSEQLTHYGEQLKDFAHKKDYYNLMAKISSDQAPKKSIEYLFKVIALKDSIAANTLDSDLKVIEAQYEFDLERKDLEFQQILSEKKIETQRSYLLLFLAILCGALVVVLLQVRNRKKLKQLIVQLSEREQALSFSNRRLDRFSSSISHDIINKLDYILAFGNSKIENQPPDLQGFKYFYEENKDTIFWLKNYCKDLLTWSKEDTTKDNKNHQSNLQIIAEAVLSSYEYELEQKQIDLEIKDLPVVTMAEAPLIQILENLVGNALKHTKNSSIPRLKISAKKDRDKWVIAVEDNGGGIPEHLQHDIFKKSEDSAEHGKGLSYVKSTLEEHGERIWVASNEWGGASFYFTSN